MFGGGFGKQLPRKGSPHPGVPFVQNKPQGPGTPNPSNPGISAQNRPQGPGAPSNPGISTQNRPQGLGKTHHPPAKTSPAAPPKPVIDHKAGPPQGPKFKPGGGQLHFQAGLTIAAGPEVEDLWATRQKLWKTGRIFVSAVLSIHNRSRLFRRALLSYLWQTMPPENWEILLLDDMSTEDLSKTYSDMVGRINMRHIKVDHRRHPLWAEKNPGYRAGDFENWYHTPAITMNLGFHLSRAPVICLCHPEILHAPENLERAAIRIFTEEQVFLFGTTYLGTQLSNKWLDKRKNWISSGWHGFLNGVDAQSMNQYREECYWYTSFLPRKACRLVQGVDFAYLNGVAGEDDDFRERVKVAGYQPIHAPELVGFHQDHSHEREYHRRRDTNEWASGLETNRQLYLSRKQKGFPILANKDLDWTAQSCFVEERRFSIGTRKVEVIDNPQRAVE